MKDRPVLSEEHGPVFSASGASVGRDGCRRTNATGRFRTARNDCRRISRFTFRPDSCKRAGGPFPKNRISGRVSRFRGSLIARCAEPVHFFALSDVIRGHTAIRVETFGLLQKRESAVTTGSVSAITNVRNCAVCEMEDSAEDKKIRSCLAAGSVSPVRVVVILCRSRSTRPFRPVPPACRIRWRWRHPAVVPGEGTR